MVRGPGAQRCAAPQVSMRPGLAAPGRAGASSGALGRPVGLRSARSSSRDFRPSGKHGRGRTKSSLGRPFLAGSGARPEPQQAPEPPKLAGELRRGPGRLRQLVVLGVPRRGRCQSARSAAASPGRVSGVGKSPGALPPQVATSVGPGLQGAPKPGWDTQAASRAPRTPNGSPRSLSDPNAVRLGSRSAGGP